MKRPRQAKTPISKSVDKKENVGKLRSKTVLSKLEGRKENGTKPAAKPKTQKVPKKRLEDFARSKPAQMELFESLLPNDQQFSNTIEFYDFCPKYVYWRTERVGDKFLDRIERAFECRGAGYRLSIDPAKIKDSDGVVRDYFPGVAEELVEDALRKLAVDGHGLFLDDQAAVTFTLYELQKELSKTGHTYSLEQIKKALMVCVGTTIHLTTQSGETVFSDHLFETVGLNTREDWKGQGKKTKAFVRFNSLVTKSIKEGSWRQFNYEVSMRFKHVVSRQLNKRMSHHFTQAHLAVNYSILLSTMLRDFGLTTYSYVRDNLRHVTKALDEMVEKRVIRSYEVKNIYDADRKNKLVDALIELKPDINFVTHAIAANVKQKTVKQLVTETRS